MEKPDRRATVAETDHLDESQRVYWVKIRHCSHGNPDFGNRTMLWHGGDGPVATWMQAEQRCLSMPGLEDSGGVRDRIMKTLLV